MRNLVIRALVLAVVAGGLFVIAPSASACTQMCVADGSPFCRVCADVGDFTGVTCEQSGPCVCFFTQNNCFAAAEDGEEQPEFLAEPALMTPFVPEGVEQEDGESLPLLVEV